MSRRKKSSGGRRPGPKPQERTDTAAPTRPAPTPNPPPPSKPFLCAATILLAVWITFLVYLAVML